MSWEQGTKPSFVCAAAADLGQGASSVGRPPEMLTSFQSVCASGLISVQEWRGAESVLKSSRIGEVMPPNKHHGNNQLSGTILESGIQRKVKSKFRKHSQLLLFWRNLSESRQGLPRRVGLGRLCRVHFEEGIPGV